MNEILSMSISEMPLCEFDCSCGHHHSFSVHDMTIGRGAIADLPRMAAPFKDGTILVVFDNNTYKVAGKRAVELLKENGFRVKELLFDCGDGVLLPDEKTFGRIVQEQELDTSLMIAVGSGVLNDSVKFVTSRAKLPYIIVGTAPSMDGYVASGAPQLSCGRKVMPDAHLPYGLIGDIDIIMTAPQDLIEAGYGDIVGKITAIADWDLALKQNGDERCDTCITLVSRAMDKCFATAEGLKTRDPEAMEALFEGLTLAGVAMAVAKSSRPASGAEHLMSHYWEMDAIAKGQTPNHHGVQVGVATPVIIRAFEEMADLLPKGTLDLCPSPEYVKELLARAGAPTSPVEIGIEREVFYQSILHSHKIRDRFSILSYACETGRLEAIADKLTREYYG